MLDFAPFRGLYVREFELSHSNLVNSIIKITHAHNLHVRTLPLLLFVSDMTHIVYEINLLKRLKQITSFSNICNKIVHHSTLRFFLFFIQDIYYYNYKELLKKKIITKF